MPYEDREYSIQGADYEYEAIVSVNIGDPLAKAWLTFKQDMSDADPGVLQKVVTTTNSAGVGQITDGGSITGIATIRFDLTAAESAALSPRDYYFDVKVKTAGTSLAYGAGGLWHFYQNVTDATT